MASASKEEDHQKLESLMVALRELRSTEQPKGKRVTKRKRKGRKTRRKSKAKGKHDTQETHADDDDGEVEEEEEIDFPWPPCACGINHPPVEKFSPPDGKTCTFYWQLADMFPFITLHRALTTEIKFLRADQDQSGVLEIPELKQLLRGILGNHISDRMVERTFKEIDTDESGTLDFIEVLAMVDTMVQRKSNKLPETMQTEYSKVCSIQ